MSRRRINVALLTLSTVMAAGLFPLAAFLWVRAGERAFAISIFLLGLSLGPCLALYAIVPRRRKQMARRFVLFTGGLSILAFAVLGAVNLDLEGFFMLLMLGTAGAAIGHTLVTVILGPVVLGRFLCGWACWRAMILEVLPMGRGSGRRGGVWNVLPVFGLALSIAAAAGAIFLCGDRPGGTPAAMHSGSVQGILIGVAVYYGASILIAFAMRDQRAFCKYLCPSGVILGLTSRFAIFKMTSDVRLCNGCGACSKVCPMDIDVARFAVLGARVRSGQCILCQRCAHACPTDALRLAGGFDVAGRTPFLKVNGAGWEKREVRTSCWPIT